MTKARLLYSNDSNMTYAIKEHVVDRCIYFEDKKGKSHGVFSALEIDRMKSKLDCVHSLEATIDTLKTEEKPITVANVIKHLLEEAKIDTVEIPNDFPAKLYLDLKNSQIDLEIVENIFARKLAIRH